MFRACASLLVAFLPTVATGLSQTPAGRSEIKTFQDLLEFVRQREQAVETVMMRISTAGTMPDGSHFSTTGTLRVLGATHFQASMRAVFEEMQLETETETVRTPGGMWMRESDPVQGEIHLYMNADLMTRLQAATAFLAGDEGAGKASATAGLPGTGGAAESPLGGAMLADMAKQFSLELRGEQVLDGRRCHVVNGPARGGAIEDPLGLGADRVDLLVRADDGAVVRMTQLKNGEPLLEVRIDELVLGKDLDPASFRIDFPDGVEVLDILQHPPAREQIGAVFAEAEAKGWKDPADQQEPAEPAAGERRDG